MGIVKILPPPDDKNIFSQVAGYFTEIAKGMSMTFGIFIRQLLKREETNTLEWPEQPANYGDRFKGKHFLTLREDGNVRCTACFLCSTACPADCIHIEAAEHEDGRIEKYPARFEIDILRCVFCGLCEEACPVDAIRLGPEYAMAGLAGEKWVYTKDYLTKRESMPSGIVSVKEENTKHPLHETDSTNSVAADSSSYVKHGTHS